MPYDDRGYGCRPYNLWSVLVRVKEGRKTDKSSREWAFNSIAPHSFGFPVDRLYGVHCLGMDVLY